MSPLTSPELPGFDSQQTFTIRALITSAVAEGVEKGIGAYQKEHCAEHIRHTDDLRHTTYGSETQVGLVERVRSLEKFESRINRITWLAVAAFLTAIAGLVLTVLPHINSTLP